MAKLVALRGEEPPDDVVVVVRGGINGLSPDVVVRAARRSLTAFGFLGISVSLAIDEPVEALCARLDGLRRYGQVRLSTAGALRRAGFALLATGQRPHFDIVLPDVESGTIVRLDAVFGPAVPNPGQLA
jgi:hypothetical protein